MWISICHNTISLKTILSPFNDLGKNQLTINDGCISRLSFYSIDPCIYPYDSATSYVVHSTLSRLLLL